MYLSEELHKNILISPGLLQKNFQMFTMIERLYFGYPVIKIANRIAKI